MKSFRDEERLMQQLDEQSRESSRRVRQVIMEAGRPDVLAEYEADMRNLNLGLTSARSCWRSISPAQAYALAVVGTGRTLRRTKYQPTFYDAYGEPHAVSKVCRLNTARALCAHELLAPDGGALDPEAKFVITERGSFVLRFGHHFGSFWRPSPSVTNGDRA